MQYKEFPILYVDDDGANRVVMKHNLGRDFTLWTAESADAALEILASEFIAVLLTDQRMPRVTGVDLAAQTRERYPDVVRVIITAYSDLEATIDAINRAHVNRFIKKPWTREEVVAVMRESIVAFHNARLVKQLQGRLLQLDRISSVAIMGSAIAHDLRQPLSYVEPNMHLLIEDVAELRATKLSSAAAEAAIERIHEGLVDVAQGVEQFKVMADTLLKSIQGRSVTVERLDLRQVIKNATAITRSSISPRGRLLVHLPNEPVCIDASEGRLYQLIVNLLLNAAQSLDLENKPVNSVELRLDVRRGQVVVEVEDTGCGIASDQRQEIFKPFITTRGQNGSGLGLAICTQVVDELDGSIEVRSRVGEGTCFTVTLPAAPAAGQGDAPM